jgi:hypothetical protein
MLRGNLPPRGPSIQDRAGLPTNPLTPRGFHNRHALHSNNRAERYWTCPVSLARQQNLYLRPLLHGHGA